MRIPAPVLNKRTALVVEWVACLENRLLRSRDRSYDSRC